jgi:hypothetical protein
MRLAGTKAEKKLTYCTVQKSVHSGHLMTDTSSDRLQTEAESLNVIGTKVLRVSFLLFTVTSTYGFYSPPPFEQKWFETGL